MSVIEWIRIRDEFGSSSGRTSSFTRLWVFVFDRTPQHLGFNSVVNKRKLPVFCKFRIESCCSAARRSLIKKFVVRSTLQYSAFSIA